MGDAGDFSATNAKQKISSGNTKNLAALFGEKQKDAAKVKVSRSRPLTGFFGNAMTAGIGGLMRPKSTIDFGGGGLHDEEEFGGDDGFQDFGDGGWGEDSGGYEEDDYGSGGAKARPVSALPADPHSGGGGGKPRPVSAMPANPHGGGGSSKKGRKGGSKARPVSAMPADPHASAGGKGKGGKARPVSAMPDNPYGDGDFDDGGEVGWGGEGGEEEEYYEE